jgi:predicted DNA-binding transcriptional regulator AlpA
MIPKLLRFKNLKELRIVANWTTLSRWINNGTFPPGQLIGPNTRVWTEEEVSAWWDSRVDPPPEIVKPAPSAATEGSGQTVSNKHPTDNRIASHPQASNGRARA